MCPRCAAFTDYISWVDILKITSTTNKFIYCYVYFGIYIWCFAECPSDLNKLLVSRMCFILLAALQVFLVAFCRYIPFSISRILPISLFFYFFLLRLGLFWVICVQLVRAFFTSLLGRRTYAAGCFAVRCLCACVNACLFVSYWVFEKQSECGGPKIIMLEHEILFIKKKSRIKLSFLFLFIFFLGRNADVSMRFKIFFTDEH